MKLVAMNLYTGGTEVGRVFPGEIRNEGNRTTGLVAVCDGHEAFVNAFARTTGDIPRLRVQTLMHIKPGQAVIIGNRSIQSVP